MRTDPPLTAYIVPHTHWDREWYLPFEAFRARLVDVVDTVVALLHDPTLNYRRFTLDGQAVVLDDYLAVKPEMRGTLAALVAEGRLRIGPWYVLADEFLVSPEALTRNLLLGRATCAPFGGAMPVAYTPDSFGHIAQLPLLIDGFGLKGVIFERGVGDEGERLGSEFMWRSADGGSEVFAVHLIGTYSAATALGHLDWEYQDRYDPERARSQMRGALFGPKAGEPSFPDWLRHALERLPEGMVGYTRSGHLLLLNGSDHLYPQANIGEAIRDVSASIETVRFVHADVEEFVDAPRGPRSELQRHQGSFRGSRYHHVLSGVWSTRMPLKQANHASETLLERYAEPLAALAHRHTGHDDRALLRHAWRTLLLNHPHDSICGCSIDAVDHDMRARNAVVAQTGHEIARRAVVALSRDLPRGTLALFNPLPTPGVRVARTTLDLPAGEGARLQLLANGEALPSQLRIERLPAPGRSDRFIDRVHASIAVPAEPLGLTWLTRGEHEAPTPPVTDPVTLTRTAAGWELANASVHLTLSDAGALTLVDRHTGAAQPLALTLESELDAGDSYDFSPVPGATPVRNGAALAAPEALEAGPLRSALAWEVALALPERLADDRRTPLGRAVLRARIELMLSAHAEHAELSVSFEQTAHDQRLRLRLTTGILADHAIADAHWHQEHIPLAKTAHPEWYQQPISSHHQRRYTAVCDAARGLALVARGLPEAEVIRGATGVELAVTLVRAVGWLSRDDLVSRPQGAGPALATPGAQCLGPQRMELALAPFAGSGDSARLQRAAEAYLHPPLIFSAGFFDPRPDLQFTNGEADRPAAAMRSVAGVQVSEPLILSACKCAEEGDALIVRVWNPTPARVHGEIRLPHDWPIDRLLRAHLDERDQEPAVHDRGTVALTLEPSQVLTLKAHFNHRGGSS